MKSSNCFTITIFSYPSLALGQRLSAKISFPYLCPPFPEPSQSENDCSFILLNNLLKMKVFFCFQKAVSLNDLIAVNGPVEAHSKPKSFYWSLKEGCQKQVYGQSKAKYAQGFMWDLIMFAQSKKLSFVTNLEANQQSTLMQSTRERGRVKSIKSRLTPVRMREHGPGPVGSAAIM